MAAAPRAQEAGRTYRLGFLIPSSSQTPATLALFNELRLNGFIEGQTSAAFTTSTGDRPVLPYCNHDDSYFSMPCV